MSTDARLLTAQPTRTRILGLAPMVLFSVSAMITLDSVATVAASGWRGIAVFTLLAVVFYAPYGFITAELGSAWPQEGGIYVWIREAYGERVGGVCAWFYWVNLAYWAPAVFVIFAGTVRSAFWPSMSRTWEELIVIGLLWLVVVVGILPLRFTTWVNNASAAAKIAVLAAAALVGLVFAARHGIANPVTTSQLWPGTGIGLAAVAVIISNFCGFEVMSSVAGSVRNPRRDIPRMILIAGVAIVGTQILGMAGILAALPLDKLSIVSGIADAMDLSFRLVLGSGATAAYDVVIVLLLFTFVGTMITWSIGANHSINVTGLDRSAPRVFGHINRRFGTPDYAFVLMATLATALTVVNYALFGGNEQVFWTIFSLSSVAFMAPYTLMFPALLVLRRRFPDVPRPYRVPGGRAGAWVAVILAETFVVLGLVLFLVVIPTGQSRLVYTAIVAGGGVVTLLVGIWLSRRRRPEVTTGAPG
jgi:glutamate:GABA antiporter